MLLRMCRGYMRPSPLPECRIRGHGEICVALRSSISAMNTTTEQLEKLCGTFAQLLAVAQIRGGASTTICRPRAAQYSAREIRPDGLHFSRPISTAPTLLWAVVPRHLGAILSIGTQCTKHSTSTTARTPNPPPSDSTQQIGQTISGDYGESLFLPGPQSTRPLTM